MSKQTKDILWFKDIKKEDIPLVGGKGANLGEMFKLFKIPNGFCITVHGYRKFMEDTGIISHVHGLLDSLDIEDTDQLEVISTQIREMILKHEFPVKLTKEIKNEYEKLDHNKVAVRSSATAEDLPTASFAGQQDTYLNVKGMEELILSIHKCWASLFTSRAIYYREKNNFKHRDVLIAVVIQEMIDPKYAGVMFTVDPIMKKDILIEVVEGLGEKLVSGEVTPNTYFVDKNNFDVKNENIIFDFDKSKLKGIAQIGIEIEKHFKSPQDIEFAIDENDELFILQSRAITTL